ncbi:hypothetical protein LIER_41716 [Lithospermum erythrorhizon]|uniref:Uncharacterized protein n=1 Tax=Lithospermum erythrorhizon TaxID=34254 RepID=A0AAV3RD98_LITER
MYSSTRGKLVEKKRIGKDVPLKFYMSCDGDTLSYEIIASVPFVKKRNSKKNMRKGWRIILFGAMRDEIWIA